MDELVKRLRDRIADLETQLESAFPVVPDQETKVTLAVLDVVASGQKPLSEGGARATAKLITRLATERAQYQEAMQTYSGAVTKAIQAQSSDAAKLKRMEEALVAHNDILRSTKSVCDRVGTHTNWEAFARNVDHVLTEYHEITNIARAALTTEQETEKRNDETS